MAVEFQRTPTGNEHLDIVQQKISEVISAIQNAPVASGITQVQANYLLRAQDRYVLVTAATDVVITLGSPAIQSVASITNHGPKSVTVKTGDNQTSFGAVPVGSSITVIANGRTWVKT